MLFSFLKENQGVLNVETDARSQVCSASLRVTYLREDAEGLCQEVELSGRFDVPGLRSIPSKVGDSKHGVNLILHQGRQRSCCRAQMILPITVWLMSLIE